MEWQLELGPIKVERAHYERQLDLWKEGVLGYQWAERFAALREYFDDRFLAYYENQGMRHEKRGKKHHGGYGFVDTLAAITLHHTTGYLPLAPTHDFRFLPGRAEIVEGLLSEDQIAVIRGEGKGRAQAPDLLMYEPDLSKTRPDWFFCEVKGPRDRLTKAQPRKFAEISEVTGRPIRVLSFVTVSSKI